MLLTAHMPVTGLLSIRYCKLSHIFLYCPCCAGVLHGHFCRQVRQHRPREGQAVAPSPQHGPLLRTILLQASRRLSSSSLQKLLRGKTGL